MKLLRAIIQNGLLVVTSVLVLFLVLEAGTRVYTGNYSFGNILEDHLRISMALYPTRYDEILGWASREGELKKDRNVERITILKGGIRSNGEHSRREYAAGERPVLAIGDSYTFGYEVKDNETWPAILEGMIGRRVINGGVFAYGMDQALVRARQLLDTYDPDTLIFSFIPNDIWRCQISSRAGVNKPYFSVRSNKLVLENTPVPRPALTDFGNPGIRKYLGYSAFMHYFMMNYGFGMWWIRGEQWTDNKVHDDATGEKIACMIIRELDQLAVDKGIKVYLLAQYGRNTNSPWVDKTRRVIKCANPENLTVIDLHEPLLNVKEMDEQEYKLFFTKGRQHHMTFDGNTFVAKEIYKAMAESGAGAQ